MNLFSNPSLNELRMMIKEVKNNRPVHDVVLDYDGEVLIDPQLNQPELDLNKFKFRIQLNELEELPIDRRTSIFRYLFICLMSAWNAQDILELATA